MKFWIVTSKLQSLSIQLSNNLTTIDHSKHNDTKQGIIHSLFNFSFGTSSSVEEISAF